MAKILMDTHSIDSDISEQNETLKTVIEASSSDGLLPYSLEVCKKLRQTVDEAQTIRQYSPSRYDVEDMLNLNLIGVCPDVKAKAIFKIEKFVGGGFAGQVYRVKLIKIESNHFSGLKGLEIGKTYAIKILIPPSGFSVMFRNLIYWLAYQGPFSAQVHFAAARAGVLWQKLIRRGAKIYFGSEQAVVDTYATFYDETFNSFGEVNEWVAGRNWKFEIDDQIFRRKKGEKLDQIPDDGSINSPEYLAKRKFMAKLVQLLHDMGAPELARQYEWGTMKSQPNALKRIDSSNGKVGDLTAIDFRAGLALLPFLPMSPADFKLIIKGLLRGNLVQFDRGNLKKLAEFINHHKEEFEDLMPAYEELLVREPQYRESLPDISHQGLKLIYKRSLRKSVKEGLIKGWESKELIDKEHGEKLNRSWLRFILFYITGILPLLGNLFRRLWGNRQYARHIKHIFTKRGYFRRTLRAKQAHALIDWYRDGRVSEEKAFKLVDKPFRFWSQRFLISWLPPTWHRFFTDKKYAWDSLKYAVTYPIRFYRDAEFRESWLLQHVSVGYEEGMLSEEEAEHIRENVKDPFIQKYLKCVAVHVATLPITQVISVIAALYAMIRFGQTWSEGLLYAGAVLAAFQATPVSPGSLVRGTYVLYLMIKERNIKNYWIAALISFWHYIGYLGFPIQMVAKFPALSRLMAGRWATNIVHIIPVFGERGALLEHWVFDLFFNLPISIRRMIKKKKLRKI
jgi:hypothetical protein